MRTILFSTLVVKEEEKGGREGNERTTRPPTQVSFPSCHGASRRTIYRRTGRMMDALDERSGLSLSRASRTKDSKGQFGDLD